MLYNIYIIYILYIYILYRQNQELNFNSQWVFTGDS